MPILAPMPPGSKSMSVQRLFHPRTRVRFAQFGYEVRQFHLPHDGLVEFAQWQHPYDMPKVMTQAAVDAVRQLVSRGDFVIDIGAHSGDTTIPMALAAGPAGCTLALEPNPYVYKVLVVNAALNPEKTNIVPRCCAATEHDGNFVFHYSDAAFCNGGFRTQQRWPIFRRKHALTVAGRNLRQMLQSEFTDWLPKLSYIKVDAEGYDRTILASILSILRERRPVVRTEVFRKLVTAERYALFDLLARVGYRLHRFRDGAQPLGAKLDRRDMTGEKHFDVIAIPR
ncbi:MAG TPA: FkbM family methyltransferase [Lacipirellulaceae bacterium]|nr:FkbM family methyltransferase [Lacipirellulaceae bacterium]